MDNESCAQGLAEFIVNIELQEQITEYLKTHDYGNMGEVEKLYKIINENDNENDNEDENDNEKESSLPFTVETLRVFTVKNIKL